MIIHKEFAQSQGRLVCEKLKDLIPRHNFMEFQSKQLLVEKSSQEKVLKVLKKMY